MQLFVKQSVPQHLDVMLSHGVEIEKGDFVVAFFEYHCIAGASSVGEEQGGANAEYRISSQDQRNVQALFSHFIHTSMGRTAVPMALLAWPWVLVPGRGLRTWGGARFAGTAGGGRRQESFAG